jgi:single-strand DNA-binding protein
MSIGDTTLTVAGNLTADPDLRFLPNSSTAVATFTIAATRRTYDQNAGAWKDGDTLFLRAVVWRELAEHVTESLTKGTRVIAHGRLKQRTYEDAEGVKRTIVELEVEEIGPSLKYATARVTKTTRDGAPHPTADSDQADPWASPAPAGAAGPGEPPF